VPDLGRKARLIQPGDSHQARKSSPESRTHGIAQDHTAPLVNQDIVSVQISVAGQVRCQRLEYRTDFFYDLQQLFQAAPTAQSLLEGACEPRSHKQRCAVLQDKVSLDYYQASIRRGLEDSKLFVEDLFTGLGQRFFAGREIGGAVRELYDPF
jgi:hypothetical protein